jgi:poly(A) polymerase
LFFYLQSMLSVPALRQLPLPEALSLTDATPIDAENNISLQMFLNGAAPTADDATLAAPKAALRRLRDAFVAWSGTKAFHMFVSGSYRLGAYTKDADIDVVFVTTARITRDAVFRGFVAALLQTAGVTEVQPVLKTRVPIISLKLDGQEFDVLTCHLRTEELPSRDALLQTYDWMGAIDESCVLAFSAIRVTELLIGSVPVWDQYLLALRFLRLWAKRRCVYSNKAGYFGGVNLALLTCFVVRLYPKALACTVVTKFFELFSEWRWGSGNPVSIDTTCRNDGTCPVWLAAMEWVPHVGEAMVVLTPCFPRTNSMFSASTTSCLVMHRELRRGLQLLSGDAAAWDATSAPLALLVTCPRFLRVTVSAPSTAKGRSWQGYMESQTRHLVHYLSKQELAVKDFRYIPKWVTRVSVQDPPRPSASSPFGPPPGPDSNVNAVPTHELVTRETYICAEDDGKIRTYVIRGRIDVPLEYFLRMHADNGPPRPRSGSVSLQYIGASDVLPDAVDGDAEALRSLSRTEPQVLSTLTAERIQGGTTSPAPCGVVSVLPSVLGGPPKPPVSLVVYGAPEPFVYRGPPYAKKRIRVAPAVLTPPLCEAAGTLRHRGRCGDAAVSAVCTCQSYTAQSGCSQAQSRPKRRRSPLLV